jgi:hypothetical protein
VASKEVAGAFFVSAASKEVIGTNLGNLAAFVQVWQMRDLKYLRFQFMSGMRERQLELAAK